MRSLKLRSFVGLAVFGLALMLGTNDANAQGWGQMGKNQKKAIKQQQKLEKERMKFERQQLRMEQARYRVYRNGGWYNTDQRGADLLRRAINDGYRQGFSAGRADRNRRVGLNWGAPPPGFCSTILMGMVSPAVFSSLSAIGCHR